MELLIIVEGLHLNESLLDELIGEAERWSSGLIELNRKIMQHTSVFEKLFIYAYHYYHYY